MADVIAKINESADVKNGGSYINSGGPRLQEDDTKRVLEDRIYDGPEPTYVEDKYTSRFQEG